MLHPTKLEAIRNLPITDECLEWIGCKNRNGYGLVWFNGAMNTAHRVAHLIHIGPVPDGQEVCHRCDNRPCFNPRHLFAATHQQNVADSFNKGRRLRSGNPPRRTYPRNPNPQRVYRRLSEQQVKEIRAIYRPGVIGSGPHVLAHMFGVSRGAIWNITKDLRKGKR